VANLLYFNFTEYLLTNSVLKSFAKERRNRMYLVSWNISWNVESVSTKPVVVLIVIVLLTIAIISQNVSINFAYAETGTGTDIFKVIMSVFGVEESKGDVVTLVTVNNQESKVKFFDASG
jgi:predicted phosphatase